MSDPAEKQRENSDKVIGRLFKKGESGNPKGRPKKGCAIADILNSKGDELLEDGRTLKEKMLHTLYEKAVKYGDLKAIAFIAERTEGKPLQPMQIETSKPIKVFDMDF